MNSEKYIGLDVHQATIVVAVMDSTGKLVMESILETKAATILQFFAGLRGTLSVTFEGTWSAWLYDLLHSRVDQPEHNYAPETAIRDVANALRRNLDETAFDQVLATLPHGAREFWQL